jgi:hypothetical protein
VGEPALELPAGIHKSRSDPRFQRLARTDKILPVQHVVEKQFASTPNDDDLTLINKFSRRELARDDVYVARFGLCNTEIDRDDEFFERSILKRFGDTLPGKGLFLNHDKSDVFGAWYRADLADTRFNDLESTWLFGNFYIPKSVGERVIEKIDTGLYRYGSIGFAAEDKREHFDAKGKLICKSFRDLTGKSEALEASIVWLGAQYGAAIQKALDAAQRELQSHTSSHTQPHDRRVRMFKIGKKEFEGDLDSEAQTEIERVVRARDDLEALREAAGVTTVEEARAQKALAEEGKAQRDALIEDALAKGKLAKGSDGKALVTDEEIADLKAALGGMKTAAIARLRDQYAKQIPPAGKTEDQTRDEQEPKTNSGRSRRRAAISL